MVGWRLLRSVSILIFGILSAGIGTAWYTSSLFPWLHLSAFTSAFLVLVTAYNFSVPRMKFYWAISMLSVVGVAFRAPMVLLPGTLSGNDPEKYAMFARLTLSSGSYRLPETDFYGIAGGFHTYIAETAAIAGLSPEQAMAVVGTLFGVWGPVVAASFCVLLFGRNERGYEAAVLAATVASISTLSVRVSYIPFAQSVGTILFVSFLWASLRHLRFDSLRRRFNWACLLLLLVAMAFTHKIPVLIASALLFAAWVSSNVARFERVWPWQSTDTTLPVNLVLVAVMVAIIQQTIVTSYVSKAFHSAQATVGSSLDVPTRLGAHPEAGAVVDIGLLSVFESHSHAPVILAVAGMAWIVLAWYFVVSGESTDGVAVAFLTIVAALTTVVLIALSGAFSSAVPHPMRFQALQELLLASLVGAGIVLFEHLYSRTSYSTDLPRFHVVLLVLMSVLLLFHGFATVAAPDYPGQERGYLTEGEVSGKEFTFDHIETEIWTDNRLQRQTPHRDRITDKESPWIALGQAPRGTRYSTLNFELVQGTAVSAGHETLLYRPNEQIYGTGSLFKDFRYRLTWDVEQHADEEYHRVYDNDHSLVYRNPA